MTVPEVLTIKSAIVLPLVVNVPVPTIVTDTLVYVPVLDNVNALTYKGVVAARVDDVVPKSNVLNQLPFVIVGILAPDIKVRLGLLVAEPPAVLPKANVLVTDIVLVNPPVPVYVNPVAVFIAKTVVPSVVCANIILFVPNVIPRVFTLFELNIPVVKLNPFKFSVPFVKVVEPVAVNVNADDKLVVIPTPLIIKLPNVELGPI